MAESAKALKAFKKLYSRFFVPPSRSLYYLGLYQVAQNSLKFHGYVRSSAPDNVKIVMRER